jgi:tetratricopeptide (TPR) repeat protein
MDTGPATVPAQQADLYMQAEAYRKAGEYARAGKIFHALLRQRASPSVGWRYAFCLRRAGYPEAALKVAEKLSARWPQDGPLAWELQWCLYAARLRPAQAAQDNEGVLAAARDMVAAGAQGLALQLAVLAAVQAARRKGQWGEVSRWCDRLDPETLATESPSVQGRRLPSPRQRWYYAKLKALVHLEDWAAGEQVAARALELYPGNIDFRRWAASCRAGLGRTQEALEMLEPHLRERQRQWYVVADAALYLARLGRIEEAWKVAQDAARLRGEDKAKVGLWHLMARLCLDLGKPLAAAHHLGWCMALRREEGWPLRPELEEMRKSLSQTLGAQGPAWEQPSATWRTLCQSHWKEASEAPGAQARRRGRVMACRDDRPFAFLRCGKEQIFVLVRDLPEDCRHDGAEVEFDTVANYDQKRKRESVRAIRVRRAQGGPVSAPATGPAEPAVAPAPALEEEW